jgi:hypothetical protein
MTQEGGAGPEIRVGGTRIEKILIEIATIRKEADLGVEIGRDGEGPRLLQKEEGNLRDEISDPQANLKMKKDIRDPNLQGKTRPTKNYLWWSRSQN